MVNLTVKVEKAPYEWYLGGITVIHQKLKLIWLYRGLYSPVLSAIIIHHEEDPYETTSIIPSKK